VNYKVWTVKDNQNRIRRDIAETTMIVELLQTFGRIVIAILSGAMLIFGTIFFADILGRSDALETIGKMSQAEWLRYIFLPSVAVAMYVLGVINVAASGFVFNRVAGKAQDDLVIVSRIESLKKPQLLKETLDVLNIKRTLIAFFFPLFYFGLMLAIDTKQWDSKMVSVPVGLVLAASGPWALWLAKRISYRLDSTVDILSPAASDQSHSLLPHVNASESRRT